MHDQVANLARPREVSSVSSITYNGLIISIKKVSAKRPIAISPNDEGQCLAPNKRSKELGVTDHYIPPVSVRRRIKNAVSQFAEILSGERAR